MRMATLGLAAVVLAGFLASDVMAQRHYSGHGGHHGDRVSSAAHHGRSAYAGHHGSHHRSAYGHGYHGYHGSGHHGYGHGYRRGYGYDGYRSYRAPVIVTPPACGYPPVHGVYRPNYHSLNTFYYRGRNFGIGVSF